MKIQYVANDGMIFNSARECREHEKQEERDAGCLGFILCACIVFAIAIIGIA